MLSEGKTSLISRIFFDFQYQEYGRLLDRPLKKENNYLNENVICNMTIFRRAFFVLFTLPTCANLKLSYRRGGAFLPTQINSPLQIFTMFPGLEAAFVVCSANKTTLGQHYIGLTTLISMRSASLGW